MNWTPFTPEEIDEQRKEALKRALEYTLKQLIAESVDHSQH